MTTASPDRGPADDVETLLDERFRYAFEQSATPMALLGLEGHHLRVNGAYCEMTERPAEELIRLLLAEIIDADDFASYRAAMEAMMGGERDSFTGETRFLRPDGVVAWGLMTTKIVSEEGRPLAFFTQVQDITALKKAEEALRESQARLGFLLEGARDLLMFRFSFRPELRCEYMSAAVESLTGFPPEAFYSDPALTLRVVHPDDRPKLEQALMNPTPDAEPLLLRWMHADGRAVWTLGRAIPIIDENGERAGLEGIAYDVTAQREAEDARALEERRFSSLVENSTDLVGILAPDTTLAYISPSVEPLLGYDPAELIGANALEYVHPEDVETVANTFLANVDRQGRHPPVEFRLRHQDGTYRWVEAATTNLLDDPAVGGLVVNARDVTQRRAYEEQLLHHALHDRLTDLPNRALLLDRLGRALGRLVLRPGIVAIIDLNIDGFTSVNERLGLAAGDEILTQVAGRISGVLRSSETLARPAADEFVVVTESSEEKEPLILAARIAEVIGEPFNARGHELHLTASVGVALATEPSQSPESQLRAAQIATGRAKARGGARVEVFDEDMRQRVHRRMETETALRRALEHDELRAFYQPVVSLSDGRIAGAEALMRWERPDRGLVSPAEFIPVAEETGLIVPMGLWIFERACTDLGRWSADARRSLSMSVNLSVKQLVHPGLLDEFAGVLSSARIQPDQMSLEITESVLIQENEAVLETLIALKALGVRLGLDDFGTRYSSLTYLRHFPFDAIKVDQSFVAGMVGDARDREIVRAVIDLAHGLGLTVVAEGVETPEQLAQMRALGADRVQGFLLARPLPPTGFTELLAADPIW